MKNNTRFLTQTAMLLALTLVFQSLRFIIPIPTGISQFVIGSLVNMSLLIAYGLIGLSGASIIAVVTPIVALLQGHVTNPIMVPFVILGNLTIVLVFAYFYEKNTYTAVFAGAATKTLALYFSIVHIALPLFLAPNLPAEKIAPVTKVLAYTFGWPQLVTGIIGGFLALAIIPMLRKAVSTPAVNE